MFVAIDGDLIHAVSSGSGATTIVGLTGAFGTTEIWEQPFETLSGSCRTLTFDHYGTGLTHVRDELVTFEHQVSLVVRMLDALEIERCVLAGDSSMGTVAVEVAVRHPERLVGLCLASSGISYAPDDAARGFVAALRTDPDPAIDLFVALCLPEDEVGHLRRWLGQIIRRTGAERAARLVESFYDVDVRDRLPRVAVPTLVLQGELDALSSSRLEVGREMASLIDGADLHVLTGAGHVPTLSRPGEVAAALQGLVDGRR